MLGWFWCRYSSPDEFPIVFDSYNTILNSPVLGTNKIHSLVYIHFYSQAVLCIRLCVILDHCYELAYVIY